MRFIRTRSSIHYQANYLNHPSYFPPLEVLKKSFELIESKEKFVIDEGSRPLDGQFRKAASYSSNSQESDGKEKDPSPTIPWVMTDRELLLSLHQKVDRKHK